MLNEIVCKPGLPKSVKASISQVVRSARNPALDETRSTIAAARRAEPGGTRPLPLWCSEEGKKKKIKCILMPAVPALLTHGGEGPKPAGPQREPVLEARPRAEGLIYHRCFLL